MASYLHTCYRIGDIDRSVAFYEKLGFEERRRMDIGTEAVNVFMGLPDEDPVLELAPLPVLVPVSDQGARKLTGGLC